MGTIESSLLSRRMFRNIPHLLQSCTLSQLETQDSCIAANQNTFWECTGANHNISPSSRAQPLTVTAQSHLQYQSSWWWTLTVVRLTLSCCSRRMPLVCVCSPWRCRQHTPPVTAENTAKEKRGRDQDNDSKEGRQRKYWDFFYNMRSMHME